MKKLYSIFFLLLTISLLTSAYLLYSQSIRLDEAQSIWASTKPVNAIFVYISQDVHVPLYSLLLHFWMQIFGTSIVAARALSFLFFLVTIPILYQVAKESGNTKIALLTASFFSLSPFITWYSSETRMYSLFACVTIANHLFFLRFVRSKGEESKFWYFITALLGIYTHYFFFVILATQATFLVSEYVWMQLHNQQEEKQVFAILFFKFFTMMIPLACCFSPWAIFVISQGAASNTQPLIPPPTTFNILQLFVNFLFGFQTQGIQSLLISLWPLSVIVLFFIFTQKRHISVENLEYFVLATFFPIFLIFAISYIRPVFLSRYLIFVTPTLFFLLAWVLANYSKKTSSILTAGLILLMVGLLMYQSFSTQISVKEDYKDVSAFLENSVSAQDIIAVSAPFTIYPLEYYYQGTARIDTIPQWDVYTQGPIPPFSQKNFSTQLKTYQSQYTHIFVVLSYDQGYEKAIRNYLDMHYQLNRKKKFSPGMEVREYQLRYSAKGKPLSYRFLTNS